MKKFRFLFPLILLCCTASAFAAGPDWVSQFLNRYRPTANPLRVTAAQQPSAALLQNGALSITLSDVLRMMLDSNLNVTVDRLPPQITQFLIDTYYRPFDPTLHITATGQKSTTVSTSQLNGATSLEQLTGAYDVGIGQTLMTGTSFGIDMIMNRSSTNNSFSTYNPSWVGQVRYTMTQHLLQNRGRLPADHLIRVARNNQKISGSQFDQQLMDLVTQAENAYWDYVFSLEDIKVKQKSRDLATKTLDDIKSEVEVGTRARLDVVQAEAQLATMDDALVVSTYTSRQDQDLVKKIISSSADPGRVLAVLSPVDTLRNPSPNDTLPISQEIQIALENRPELKQAQLALNNAVIDTEYTKNQILPTLDVTATYAQNGIGGVQRLRSALGGNTVVGIIPGGIGDTFGQLFGFGYNTYAAGFSLNIPLTNKAARADHDRAVGTRQMATSQVDAVTQQIALDVRNAMNQVDMNRAHIESARKAREFAEQTLDAEQQKYELGVSTLFFVLQDQTALAVAQTNEIQAMVNYTKALVMLDRATGQTLSHNNIVVQNSNPRINTTTSSAN
jgi:outer membrane protein